MTCYTNSDLCWGSEWPIIRNGDLALACTGHKNGSYKKPVLKIEALDDGIVENYGQLKEYLIPFISEEIGSGVPVDIFGTHGLGDIAARVYARGKKNVTLCDERQPTHLFILWDLESDEVFDYLDDMLDKGVVINSLTL